MLRINKSHIFNENATFTTAILLEISKSYLNITVQFHVDHDIYTKRIKYERIDVACCYKYPRIRNNASALWISSRLLNENHFLWCNSKFHSEREREKEERESACEREKRTEWNAKDKMQRKMLIWPLPSFIEMSTRTKP